MKTNTYSSNVMCMYIVLTIDISYMFLTLGREIPESNIKTV